MIAPGNTKLGLGFWSFSIPAVLTCVGATALCLAHCYARRGHFTGGSVGRAYARNYAATRKADFSKVMSSLIRNHYAAVVRVHVSGDFYSAAYVRKWIAVARANPGTTFLAYTRSWRKAELRAALSELASTPNVRLWLSCDADSGEPPELPGAWGRAYMSLSDGDTPDYPVDLVFRDGRNRTLMKYTPQGDFVCPYEQGVKTKEKITCSRCRYCTSDEVLTRRPAAKGRTALAVVS